MIIERIHIESFGALNDVSIDGLSPGIEVLHGTNETGKTSLLEFVRGVFFGFGGLFRRGVLDPHVPCGGRILARAGVDGRQIAIERRHEGPHLERLSRASYESERDLPLADQLTVVDADGRSKTALFLQDYMGQIDERTFTAVMAFGLDELHELQTLDAEGCGSRLYELASGLDRSKVTLVLANLRTAIERLDAADPETSPIEALRQRRSAALARIAAMNAPAVAAGTFSAELSHIDAEIAELGQFVERARRAEDTLRSILPLEPLYHEHRRTTEKLATLEATPLIHADLDAWQLAAKNRDRLARLARKRKKVRSRLARELKDLPADTLIRKKRAVVAPLLDERPRLERLVTDVSRAEASARQAARRFGEQLGIAGLARLVPSEVANAHSADTLAETLLPVGITHSFGSLRERARELSEAAREVKAARRQIAAAKGVFDTTRGSIQTAGSNLGGLTIAAAIEEASGRATLYRNRIAAAEQLTDLDRSLGTLDREVAVNREGQLLPVGWLIALGTIFVLGAGMLLSGLLLPATVTGSLAYAMAALGLAGTGLASVATWSLDRAASGRLEASLQQREMVRKQRSDLLAQCGLLDKKIDSARTAERLPAEVTTLERRALLAQAEVDRLEELAAREGSLHVLADKVSLAEQSLAQSLARRSAARGRWKRGLEQRGLPVSLSPHDVSQIARHRQTLIALDDERRRTSDEARLRREELAALGHRIEAVMIECDMLPETTPLEHLEQLRERLERESNAHHLRGRLNRRLVRAREHHRAAVRRVKLAEQRVQEIIARWGVDTEKAFLGLVDRRPVVEEARREAQAAESAWLEARRRIPELPELEGWLGESRSVSLEQRLAEAHLSTIQAAEAVDRARDQRRAAAARVEACARDHSTEGVQLEIAEIEHELEGHLHRRQLLEKAALLLEETRAAFARDHQPAVLREASRWLSQLTDGHYTSITTSIHEARLEVHDAENKPWSPDRLSRGTREQVFLSLRLALVRDLERHGVRLPIVIDDALVNFDDKRALSAARVLVEFVSDQAGERQMLVLTCHAHVAKIFSDVGANVRSLSDPSAKWLRQRKVRIAPSTARTRPAAERRKQEASLPMTSVDVVPPADAVLEPGESADVEPIVTTADRPAWKAEEYFFGHSVTGDDATRSDAAPSDDTARRPPRSRRRRGPKPA
jgi:hypothetical protein